MTDSPVVHAIDMSSVVVHQNGDVHCKLAHPVKLPPGVKLFQYRESLTEDLSKRNEIRPEFSKAASEGGAHVLPLPRGYGKTTSIINLIRKMVHRKEIHKILVVCDSEETAAVYRKAVGPIIGLLIDRTFEIRNAEWDFSALFVDSVADDSEWLREKFKGLQRGCGSNLKLAILTMTGDADATEAAWIKS